MSSPSNDQSTLISEHHQAIRREYQRQAPRWGTLEITDHLRWVVDQLPLTPTSEVIDVAAGSGLFGRAVAGRVARVTEVDITVEMIEQGRQAAIRDGIANLEWRLGPAEALPFPDGGFDLAITRYSLHHFVDPIAVLREMGRVCRPGGAVVAVDMVADEDPAIAAEQNRLETVMDRTHTRVLAPSELVRAGATAGLAVLRYLSREVPMSFDRWQTQVPAESEARRAVRQALESELAGGRPTGLQPSIRDGELWFMHMWGILIAGRR